MARLAGVLFFLLIAAGVFLLLRAVWRRWRKRGPWRIHVKPYADFTIVYACKGDPIYKNWIEVKRINNNLNAIKFDDELAEARSEAGMKVASLNAATRKKRH